MSISSHLRIRKGARLACAFSVAALLLTGSGGATAEEGNKKQEEPASTAPLLRTPASFVYVLKPWHFALEESYTATLLRDPRVWGTNVGSELEVGLPWGGQLGMNLDVTGDSHRRFRRTGESVELRWALAELFHRGAGWGQGAWGWANPVLFGEWQFRDDEPDAGEVRLLFSGDFSRRAKRSAENERSVADKGSSAARRSSGDDGGWFWTANLFYEREVTADRETECGLSAALLYRFPAPHASVGAEMVLTRSTDKDRRQPEVSLVIGPSFLLEPFEHCEFKFAPLFGCTDDAPSFQLRALLEFEF